jgi:hypothetical protein
MRLDTAGAIKWSTWYHDSVQDRPRLLRMATMNCIKETSKKQIICTGGDPFPNNNGSTLDNYMGALLMDSTGKVLGPMQSSDLPGYSIAGFNVDELRNGNIVISGNQAVSCIDTNGNYAWERKYTFSLSGVGTVTNNVFRAKVLRSGTLMVCGMAYEGNCWTNFRRLEYDAWWAPLNSSTGNAAAWDTAGWQGGSDAVYDFAQLNDGTLAFCGVKGIPADSGLWVFVTDSTGKTLLWERQYNLPGYDSGGFPLTTILPMAVCATTDGGFTVVGDNNTYKNNHNACALHFVQKTVAVKLFSSAGSVKNSCPVTIALAGPRISFHCRHAPAAPKQLTIYNAAGKVVATVAEHNSGNNGSLYIWNSASVTKGVYFYRISGGNKVFTGKVVAGK